MKFIKSFKSVRAKDEYRGNIKSNECSIINMDDHNGPGTHFVAYFNSSKLPYITYFDSFGAVPPIEIVKYLKSSGKEIEYNSSQYQPIRSDLCSFYCMYFINEMNKGIPFYDILSKFSLKNNNMNDKFVKVYFSRNFNQKGGTINEKKKQTESQDNGLDFGEIGSKIGESFDNAGEDLAGEAAGEATAEAGAEVGADALMELLPLVLI